MAVRVDVLRKCCGTMLFALKRTFFCIYGMVLALTERGLKWLLRF